MFTLACIGSLFVHCYIRSLRVEQQIVALREIRLADDDVDEQTAGSEHTESRHDRSNNNNDDDNDDNDNDADAEEKDDETHDSVNERRQSSEKI